MILRIFFSSVFSLALSLQFLPSASLAETICEYEKVALNQVIDTLERKYLLSESEECEKNEGAIYARLKAQAIESLRSEAAQRAVGSGNVPAACREGDKGSLAGLHIENIKFSGCIPRGFEDESGDISYAESELITMLTANGAAYVKCCREETDSCQDTEPKPTF